MNMPAFDSLPDCPLCHGGPLYDWVPWGMGDTQRLIGCDCVAKQEDAWKNRQDAMQAEHDALEAQTDDLTFDQVAEYAWLHRQLYGKEVLAKIKEAYECYKML